MTGVLASSPSVWIARHAVLVWIGIVLNLVFVFSLFLLPQATLALFGVPYVPETIWPRFAALLLFIISAFYVPATLNFARYRPFAWLAVFPSRTFGATFFFVAVFLFGQPPGFLVGTLLDGSIGLATLVCLIKIAEFDRLDARFGERS